MATSLLRADTFGIGNLIHNRRYFKVPDHQRDFAWTEEEIDQFFDDVIGALLSGADDYFLGLLVLVEGDNEREWEILDGQQRLATVTMVYAAIREWLHVNGYDKDGETIQADYIGSRELGQSDHSPRLNLNVNNRATFTELVVNRKNNEVLTNRRDSTPRHSSDRLMLEAAIMCRHRVQKFAAEAGSEPDDQAKRLYDLARYLNDRVKVVVLDVASSANAYVIFESLNDRGLDLSVLDLVKNHLFSHAGSSRLQEVQWNWINMVSNIGDRRPDDFLKAFWTSRWGRVQRGKLFDQWRSRYESITPSNTVGLSEELSQVADQFAALEVPDDQIWNVHTLKCRSYVKTLAILEARQMWPVMLAALEKFDIQRMERLLYILLIVTLRYQTVGRRRTGQLEITSARAARGIFTGTLNSPQKVWTEFAPIVPNDKDFLNDFSRFSETKSGRARFILAELEKAHRRSFFGGTSPELVPQWEALTLEHILPSKPGDQWHVDVKADPKLGQEFVNRIGNLCLLSGNVNKELGSQGFKAKAKVYANSELELTSEIGKQYDVWDSDAIEKRQRNLADLALAAWPLPEGSA